MQVKIVVIISILCLFLMTLGAAPELRWMQTYGGSNADKGMAIQPTYDGGYITIGYTASYGPGNYDLWLLKTDKMGDTLWTRTYGGGSDDYGYAVQQTRNGGYIMTGSTVPSGATYEDLWLLKTDESGDTLWTRTYGNDYWDCGKSVQQTSDGGYIITGYTDVYLFSNRYHQIWLLKTNASGDTLWTRTYGGAGDFNSYAVQQTYDGGYIITGYIQPYDTADKDLWLLKTDAWGNLHWTLRYESLSGVGVDVRQTWDRGYIITGSKDSYSTGSCDLLLLKTDEDGGILWTQTYGGSYGDHGNAIQITPDGGYIITGYTHSYGAGEYDLWLLKTDAAGDTLWTSTYGGPGYDYGMAVQQTADGDYIIAGYTESYGAGNDDLWLLKIGIEKAPQNVSVADVPQDQGGQVQVCWRASDYDIYAAQYYDYGLFYGIWRALTLEDSTKLAKITPDMLSADFAGTACITTTWNGRDYAWEWIGNQNAAGLPRYAFTAPTLCDGIPATGDTLAARHAFLVIFHPEESVDYYLSDPAFGYSVDNLAPEAPQGLEAVCPAGQAVTLSWKANKERDMSHYLVYQSTELFSDPSQVNLIATTSDTSCQVDNLSLEQRNYFAVVA